MQLTRTLFTLVSVTIGLTGFVSAYNGDATFYFPGLGACGKTNDEGDLVAALSTAEYGDGDRCFKKIGIHYQGKYVKVTVVDKCPGCASEDVDLSPSAFSRLADEALGRIKVNWEYLG